MNLRNLPAGMWAFAALLLVNAPSAAGENQHKVPPEALAKWPILGRGSVQRTQEGVVLREDANSQGAVLLSPRVYAKDVVLRCRLRANQFKGVGLILLSVSAADGGRLVVPPDYDGAMGLWNGASARAANFLFAFHTAFHQPLAFVTRNPGGAQLAMQPDSATGEDWHTLEAGRAGGKVWLDVDGKRLLEHDAEGNRAVPEGSVGFRVRGPGDGTFAIELADVVIIEGRR